MTLPLSSSPALEHLSAAALADRLSGNTELVLLDLREEGVFARGHLFLAASMPLSRLELRVRSTVPRLDTPIVLIADTSADTQLAAQRLSRGGYTQLAVLDGGNAAWTAAGYRLFSGIYVPSKAFGEAVEHANHTPRVTVDEVRAAMRKGDTMSKGEKPCHVDSRPLSEFRDFSLPGASDCPGAELVLRAPAAAQGRPIIVNCAGRTRSIIGAQSLINAGVPNPVYALENGTMGWHLSGYELRHGAEELLALPDDAELGNARQRARALAQGLGVRWIDAATLQAMLAERQQTTYCFDVRLPEDYAAGHLPGFANAPGGQLVQSTDFYAPVRNARMVLFDTLGVQAPMTAHWLRQMGWEVAVLESSLNGNAESGWPPPHLLHGPAPTPAVEGAELAALLRHPQTLLIDCDDSRGYRRSHLREARFLTRSRIAQLADPQYQGRTMVFTSEDGLLAQFAAADAAALGLRAAHIKGGTRAAAAAVGRSGELHLLCDTDDAWYSPYQLDTGRKQAMRDYISWETGLLERLQDEPGVRFDVHVARAAGGA